MKKFLMLTVAAVGLANAAYIPASLFAPTQQSVINPKDQSIVKQYSFIDNVSAGYMDDVKALSQATKDDYTAKINAMFGDRFSKVTLARQLSTENKAFNGLYSELLNPLKEAAGEKFTQEALNSVIAKTLSEFKKQKNKSFANLKKILFANLKKQFKGVNGKTFNQLAKNNASVPALLLSSFMGRELTAEQAKNLETLMENVRTSKGKALKEAQVQLQAAFKQIFEERAKGIPARMKDVTKALKKETSALKTLEAELKVLPEGDARIEEKQKQIDEKKKEIASIEASLKADQEFNADFENIDLLSQIFSMKEVVVAFEKEVFEISSLVAKGKEVEQFRSIDAIVQLKDKTDSINKQVTDFRAWLNDAHDVPAFLDAKAAVIVGNTLTDHAGLNGQAYGAVHAHGNLINALRAIAADANPLNHNDVRNDATVVSFFKAIANLDFAGIQVLTQTVDAMIGLNHVINGTKDARIKTVLAPLFANNLQKIKEMKDPMVVVNKRNAIYSLENSLPEVQNQTLAAYLHLLNNQ